MSRHRLGFAVKVLGGGGLPSHDTRRWRSAPHLDVSLDRLERIFDYLDANDIRMYRMPTALAPYATHPDLPQFHGQISECRERLARVGARAKSLGIRLSSHPGQYTVLNSERAETRDLAVAELDSQAMLFEAMDLGPGAVIVLHVGGGAGDKEAGMDRFCAGWELLSAGARSRLVIENDDRTYDLADVLGLSKRLGCPVVWDVLHHRCVDAVGISDSEAVAAAARTWPDGVTPKIHFSSPRLDVGERRRKVGRRVERTPELPQLRAHADLVDPIAFELFLREAPKGLDLDVMLEAKAKDLALLRLREQLASRGIRWDAGSLALD